MASKFMAFEGVASTSTASMENYGNNENERIEMNTNQYPNYQSNQNHGATDTATATDSHPYGAVDEEDDLNDDLEEKTEKDVGYRKFIYNNSEQFKSICGGLLLLMGSGIHIVWGIFRVFCLYNCKNRMGETFHEEHGFYLRLVIWSWYIGAIIGSCCAGYAVAKYRKGHLYSTGGALLIVSGILLMYSGSDTDIWLLMSRIIGGFTQGLAYVVVIVHASENATKEFRELLMLIVGAVINYSILVSVLSFFHTEGLVNVGLLNGLGLVAFGVLAILITTKHAIETVPFILQTNGSELDALQTVSKLKKKPIAARSVHHDFLILKNQVQDEIEHYGTPDFRKVLLPENRKSLIFCCYGRLCSVLSFNLPLIVMIMLFLRSWVDNNTDDRYIDHNILPVCRNQCEHLFIHSHEKYEHDNIETKPPSDHNEHANENGRPKRDTSELPTTVKQDASNDENSEPGKKVKDREEGKEFKKKKETTETNEKGTETIGDKEMKEVHNAKQQHKGKDENHTSEDDTQIKSDKKLEENHHDEKEENVDEKNLKSKEESKSTEEINKEANEHQVNTNATESKAKANSKTETNKKQPGKHSEEEKISEQKNTTKMDSSMKSKTHEETEAKKTEENNRKKPEKPNTPEKSHIMETASPTFFAHFILFLRSRELTLVLLAWFIFGSVTAAALYYFNLKRFIYHISCVLSSVLVFTQIAHSFNLVSSILHICLIVYFNYVTIPMDVFGHCMLADAFPITLKAFSVASVAIVEHLTHIILITLYLTEWFHDGIILFMCIVAFMSHEIARNLPQKGNLPLAEAREQYQNIDLMLFNEPKSGYNQQQEFI